MQVVFTGEEHRRFAVSTIFRLTAVAMLLSQVPLFSVMGAFASVGAATLEWNGEPLDGLTALLAGPMMGLFFAVFMTIYAGVSLAIGLWAYSRFLPLDPRYEGPANAADLQDATTRTSR
ncbi:MAG: hypothetical protein AAF805_02710 [Planctomycetota bacterium]